MPLRAFYFLSFPMRGAISKPHVIPAKAGTQNKEKAIRLPASRHLSALREGLVW